MLAAHTIVFPTDFSEPSVAVFPVACSLAHDCGARLIVLHVGCPVGNEELEARAGRPRNTTKVSGPPSEPCNSPKTYAWNTGWRRGIQPG